MLRVVRSRRRRTNLFRRAVANLLQAQLVAFRRSLRAVLGPTHRDYQALRESRVESKAESEAADAAVVVSTPVVAAPSPSTTTAPAPVARISVVPNGHSPDAVSL